MKFKFLRAHREGVGIIMVSFGFGYILLSLLMFHGWLWIDKSNFWNQGSYWSAKITQQWLWVNDIGLAVFLLNIAVVVLGFIIYEPGEGLLTPE